MNETPTPTKSPYADYLGDGVYIDFDGFHLVLTTSNGIQTTNEIFLDPHVWNRLTEYKARLDAMLQQPVIDTEAEGGNHS